MVECSMKSNRYSQFSLHFFKKILREDDEKNLLMEKANIGMPYEEYQSLVYMNTLMVSIVVTILSITLHLLIPGFPWILIPILIGAAAGVTWLIHWYYPVYEVKRRANSIERFLPYSINFISTMAETGISPAEIFRTLAKTDIYGEIQNEAKKITKEIDVMGVDAITALKHGLERTPSKKFKAFLQGLIGTIQTGSSLGAFLSSSVERYMREDLLARKKNLEFLGLIAELFVMAVIAFPLFLVIIISIMVS